MLRIIGIFLIIAGAALFIFTYIRGRQKGIREDTKELLMIISSGYVSERVAGERTTSPFEGKTPIAPKPKKKRVLSEEARGILEMVERGRETEAAASAQPNALPEEAPAPKKGTAILPKSMEQKKKGTAVLPEDPAPQKKGTAVLIENKAPHKGTAVLMEESPKPAKKGTAVLPETPPEREVSPPQEAAPVKKKGTAVLIEEGNRPRGTAVLPETGTANAASFQWEKPKKGTAVLMEQGPAAKKGTAVLAERASDEEAGPARKGTAVLIENKEVDEEVKPLRKGTAVLKEEGGQSNG